MHDFCIRVHRITSLYHHWTNTGPNGLRSALQSTGGTQVGQVASWKEWTSGILWNGQVALNTHLNIAEQTISVILAHNKVHHNILCLLSDKFKTIKNPLNPFQPSKST